MPKETPRGLGASVRDPSVRFEGIVPQSVLDRFRRAIFVKHKEFYGHVNAEIARALSFHADQMLLEADNKTEKNGDTNGETDVIEPPGFVAFAGVFDGIEKRSGVEK